MPILIDALYSKIAIKVNPNNIEKKIAEGFSTIFARRYIPLKNVRIIDTISEDIDSLIDWHLSKEFSIAYYELGDKDYYSISSPPPEPYTNEPPFFFVLQVLARSLMKHSLLLFTDTIAVSSSGYRKAVLVLGYPHGGKSTIAALALARGLKVLATENTVIKVSQGLEIVGGTDVLVVNPRSLVNYGYKSEILGKPHDITKHGYLVYDLKRLYSLPQAPVPVSAIYVAHCSFSSRGADFEPVSGRKILKTLWYFASAIIRGLDYYEPAPLFLSDNSTDNFLSRSLRRLAHTFQDKFFEVYGSHYEVLERIVEIESL